MKILFLKDKSLDISYLWRCSDGCCSENRTFDEPMFAGTIMELGHDHPSVHGLVITEIVYPGDLRSDWHTEKEYAITNELLGKLFFDESIVEITQH